MHTPLFWLDVALGLQCGVRVNAISNATALLRYKTDEISLELSQYIKDGVFNGGTDEDGAEVIRDIQERLNAKAV